MGKIIQYNVPHIVFRRIR
ncbi:unnamed protein product [Victoria cruziana]